MALGSQLCAVLAVMFLGACATEGSDSDEGGGSVVAISDSVHLVDPVTPANNPAPLIMMPVASERNPATVQGLAGDEWVVEDIGGRGIIDYSRATLAFGDNGRLSGRTSCNGYSAPYTANGNQLTIGRAIATLRACAPALTNQEREFLRILGKVQRFRFSATGALILEAATGETITARR